MIIENVRFWLLIVPFAAILSFCLGVFHLLKVRSEREPLQESILALSSYLQGSLKIFLKRQSFLIGISIGIIIVITALLRALGVSHIMLTHFIVWGILWSSVLGYFILSRSSTATGNFLQQSLKNPEGWEKNVSRFGWTLTLLPLGLLTFSLCMSLNFIHHATTHNWLGMGTRIMGQTSLIGVWSAEILHHPLFEKARRQEINLILAAYCFGALIQTFLVKITTMTMSKSTQLSSKHVEFNYPGLGSDDLRSPLSLAHHISDYANQIWGAMSYMINTYLIVLLSASAIAIMAFQEEPLASTRTFLTLPMLITAFGLLGGCITSFFYRSSLFKQLCISASVIASLSGIGCLIEVIPLYLFGIIVLSLGTGLGLFFLHHHNQNQETHLLQQVARLTNTWLSLMLILGWMGLTVTLCDGVAHVLLGLYGIAIGGVSLLGLWLVYTAYSHRNTFIHLTITNANILHAQEGLPEEVLTTVEQANSHNGPIILLKTLLISISCLMLFFIFLAAIPHWIEKIISPSLVEQLRNNYVSLTNHLISESEIRDLLAHISFSGSAFLLGISPTRPLFLFGLFGSLSVVLGLGIFWIRAITRTDNKLFNQAIVQLEENPLILEGQVLPSYQESIQSVTNASFKTSFFLGGMLCLVVPLSVLLIGLRGLAGLLLGMIFLTLFTGLYAYNSCQVQDDSKEELTFTLTGLATQTMLLFAFLFGAGLLRFGCGL